MKLVAFDLDFPYIENEDRIAPIIERDHCTRDVAIRLDYQTYWKEKRREYSLQTRCISAFFERLFGYIDTRDCQKILVECVPGASEESIKNFSGVYTVQVHFDENSFLKLDSFDKKKMVLELLMSGVRRVVSNQGWDIKPFESVYDKIIAEEYKNEWFWKKSVKSPNGKYSANVLLQHEIDRIDISIIVYDDNKIEIFREKVISELPDEYAYAAHLGEIKWISDSKVILSDINSQNKWLVESSLLSNR